MSFKMKNVAFSMDNLKYKIAVTTAEDEDEMLMEWFKLVTKKNELVRKEADLVYQ